MNLTRSTFVYCPQSGPRWLPCASPRFGAVPTVVWGNQSAHVVGVTLSVATAQQGHYFRPLAREVASALASELRGVAWDDRGDIHLCVDAVDAPAAYRHLIALGPSDALDLSNPNTGPLIGVGRWPQSAWDVDGGWNYTRETGVVKFQRRDFDVVASAADWTIADVTGAVVS